MIMTLISIVISLTPSVNKGFLEVVTKEGKFDISNTTKEYSVFYQTLKSSLVNKSFVTIIVDKHSNNIVFVFDVTEDWVKDISNDSANQQRLVVTLMRRPSRVFLDKKNACYHQILQCLREAQKNSVELIIGIHPLTNDIEAVKEIEGSK